jgi:hypothetical protein
MQAMRIIEARDHIAQAAYAAMRRVEAEAALCRWSRTQRDAIGNLGGFGGPAFTGGNGGLLRRLHRALGGAGRATGA